MARQEVLGIDFTGVIVSRIYATDSPDLHVRLSDAQPIMDAVGSIGRLAAKRFHERIYIIVAATDTDHVTLHNRIHRWFASRDFYTRTSIAHNRFIVTKDRREKARRIETLGITHFIDDRLEVFKHMSPAAVPHRYLFDPRERDRAIYITHHPPITLVMNWKEVLTHLLPK